MNTTTTPAARFGWPGQTLEYTVRVEDADQLAAPQTLDEGVSVRVLETRTVADGVEARVAVVVSEGALY